MFLRKKGATAFVCVKCGGQVEALNEMAYRLMTQGKPALCAACRNGKDRKEQYADYRSTGRWKELARDCKGRAGGRCQVCNSPDGLEAHHRTYERLGEELPGDLTCLCRECHRLFSEGGRLHR